MFCRALTKAIALTAALALPAAARAASLQDCDTWQANARNLAFPVADTVRSYANGAVSLIGLDTGAPACCSFYIMVLWPATEGEYLDCALIAREGDLGFASLSMAETVSSYDPAAGLRLDVPVRIFLPDENFSNVGLVTVTVNQARGEVTAEFTPGPNE